MAVRSAFEWNVEEVVTWLKHINLPQYEQVFRQLSIDGSILFAITEQDLIQDFNISIRLHRFKLLEHINKLRDDCFSSMGSVATPTPSTQLDQDLYSQSPVSQYHAINIDKRAVSLHEDRCEALALKCFEGSLTHEMFIIGRTGTAIGRHSSNDIILSESYVSRRHCDIKYCPGTNLFKIRDLGSTTGTFIQTRGVVMIKPGLMFQMGFSEFKVMNLKFKPNGSVFSCEMLIYEGPARELVVSVDSKGVTIGRDPANKVCIREDPEMSSFHGRIFEENGLFYLEDVGSTNKTWLRISSEGEYSDSWPISAGDSIKVGSTKFLLQVPDLNMILSIPTPTPDTLYRLQNRSVIESM